jgi:hypothetical protein
MECAYYFVGGTWNVLTTLTFVGCVIVASMFLPVPRLGSSQEFVTLTLVRRSIITGLNPMTGFKRNFERESLTIV